ncbi:hypothetical protein [Alteribacter keqinensis]|uniref:Uncharacterized protein n=1 Tax=Alteribacter keqinensis TaxID=2483800 RepID=A0A3M7TYE6_9BACI|nr:hypothetical protein [Alteribacter keqinensis]RNA69824.1 hypothetical protein EBO34_07785 [Alteribacter keqinensis]
MSGAVWFSLLFPLIQMWVMSLSDVLKTVKYRGVYNNSPTLLNSSAVFVLLKGMAYFTFIDILDDFQFGGIVLFIIGAAALSYGIPLLINKSYLITNGTKDEVIKVLDEKIEKYNLPYDRRGTRYDYKYKDYRVLDSDKGIFIRAEWRTSKINDD